MTQTIEQLQAKVAELTAKINDVSYGHEFFKMETNRLIAELRAQLAAAQEENKLIMMNLTQCGEQLASSEQRVAEWQPISTAPKDGTWFFGWRQYATRPRIIKFDIDYGEFIDEDGIHVYEVINWMPLPKAPNGASS